MSLRLGPHSRGRPNDSNESWNSGGVRPTAYPAQASPFIVLERPTSCFLLSWQDVVVFRTASAGPLPPQPPDPGPPAQVSGPPVASSVVLSTPSEPEFAEGPLANWQVRFFRDIGVRVGSPKINLSELSPSQVMTFSGQSSIELPALWFLDPVTTLSVTVDGQAQTVYQIYQGVQTQPAVLGAAPLGAWQYPFLPEDPPEVPAGPATPGPVVLTGVLLEHVRVYVPKKKG